MMRPGGTRCLPIIGAGLATLCGFAGLAWIASGYFDAELRRAIAFAGFGLC